MGHGTSFEKLNSIEIIDIGFSSTTCQDLTKFPRETFGAFGGLASNRNPIICGGLGGSRNCQAYENGVWTSSLSFNYDRVGAATCPSPYPNATHSLFVTGGINIYRRDDSTAEVLTDSGWQTLPTSLPVSIYEHCMVLLNSTTVLMIGGMQNYTEYSPDTFYFNTDNEKWIEGPTLKAGRKYHSCGKIQSNSQSSEFSIIVAGGWDTPNTGPTSSVVILDVGSSKWRTGPSLPLGISSSSMVEEPSGVVLLIGGNTFTPLDTPLNTIYKLRHANSKWTLLPQKLKVARYFATAFLVPDEITDCS